MIEVRSPGMFTTVQDLGRQGFGPLGVSASGAADPIALRLGNLLVGNPENAAALEMTLLGGTFFFDRPAVIALTGSDFGAAVDGRPLRSWIAHAIEAKQTVRCGPSQSGARCYLCVAGGIRVPLFAGSASTHILSGLGGAGGRALQKGDVLEIGERSGRPRRLHRTKPLPLKPHKHLRVTRGTQWDWFPPTSQEALFASSYRVTEEANRMGLRLEGAPIRAGTHSQMITEGVPLGAIQIPAGGQPIILFVEQQTTGGYPKIANIISADLASVGQLRPRDEIRFELVSPELARKLICEQEALLCSPDLFLP